MYRVSVFVAKRSCILMTSVETSALLCVLAGNYVLRGFGLPYFFYFFFRNYEF